MSYSQIGIYIRENFLIDNYYWKKLISKFAVVGLEFEIHIFSAPIEDAEFTTVLKQLHEYADVNYY